MQIKSAVKKLLARRLDREYERELNRRRISYDHWVRTREQDALPEDLGKIQEASAGPQNFVLFLQSRGQLHPMALKRVEEYFTGHEECLILYGDEDVMGADGIRRSPWYKPCWSPDLYLDCFYPGSVVAVRRGFAERFMTRERIGEAPILFSDPDEWRGLMDELFSTAGGFERGCNTIARIPEILFHAQDDALWEDYLKSESGLAGEKDADAVETLVSVIIPSKDNPAVLGKCLESLKDCMSHENLEIIVVDNGSSTQNREAVETLTEGMTYLYHPMEFNFSAMCNMGASQAKGNLLLFLNDDMEMYGTEWLEQMKGKALLPYAGAVGLKLRYPDSMRIQHAGVINLAVGPAHKLQYLNDDRCYYFGRNRFNYNCLAVTGACLMVERGKFREAGGFREELKVAYNDVDLGFSLWELGFQNVVLNKCFGVHHESLSRGSDDTWEKRRRLERERMLLYEKHSSLRGRDPYYPELLNIEGLDSRIQPGYVLCGNTVQQPKWQELPKKLAGYREDKCLMARVESEGPERIDGYSVVLWDDNACYEKYLLLEPEENPERLMCMKLDGQYKDELEENLPDQKNVALGGFHVSRTGEQLEPGNYRIGVLAVHRIGSLKLLGWTGKYLKVEKSQEGEKP